MAVTKATEGIEELPVDVRITASYRLLRTLVRSLNRVWLRTEVRGGDRVPLTGPVVIAPTHRAAIDFFPLAEITDRKLHFMVKDSVWKYRRFTGFFNFVGMFPIDRDSTDRVAMRRSERVLEAGEVLILFPEGTRRNSPDVEDLHDGAAYLAARAGAPIVPVGMGGTPAALPKGKKLPRRTRVRVVVGTPIPAPTRSEGGRVPRSAIHNVTEELQKQLQALYDEAEGRT